jgi:hypothetical protein
MILRLPGRSTILGPHSSTINHQRVMQSVVKFDKVRFLWSV